MTLIRKDQNKLHKNEELKAKVSEIEL